MNGIDDFAQLMENDGTSSSMHSRTSGTLAQEAFIKQKMMHEEVEVDVVVTSYAPRVFRFIRAADQINELDIMKSVKPELNRM